MPSSPTARLVLTHSTHADGLLPALRRLASIPRLRTITPARLATARCASARLALKVTTATPSGAKLLARKGTQVQEVFLTFAAASPPAEAPSALDLAWLQREINARLAAMR